MEKLLRELIQKVDVLTKVQVATGMSGLRQIDKIASLYEAGVAQKDIASVLSIRINTVTSAVAKMGKRKRKSQNERGGAE